jgi:hypothetical protein
MKAVDKGIGLGFDTEICLMNVITALQLEGERGPWHVTYTTYGKQEWPDMWDCGDGPIHFHRSKDIDRKWILVESDNSYRQRSST